MKTLHIPSHIQQKCMISNMGLFTNLIIFRLVIRSHPIWSFNQRWQTSWWWQRQQRLHGSPMCIPTYAIELSEWLIPRHATTLWVCEEGIVHISVRTTAWQPNSLVFCSKLSTLLPSLNCCEFSFSIQSMWKIFIINWRVFLSSKNLRLHFEFNWNSLKYEVCLHIFLCPM